MDKKIIFLGKGKSKKAADEMLFCEICFETVSNHFCLSKEFLESKSRKREFVYARQACMYLICKYTTLTLQRVGFLFNNKDHATVLHGKRTIENLIDSSKKIKNEIGVIEKLILDKLKVIMQKTSSETELFYINFENYTAIRYDDNQGLLITGFSDEVVSKIISIIGLKELNIKKYQATGQYILENKINDNNTRDTASDNC